ncbi:hypothetical protein PI124_g13640 [Phytophthora idaei]|nr:hypothetical protein PI125_g19402 [Phytophthora idaei]KAG3161760.1 hypothetical protein PI126_g6301 [Phytophthora idaei]KAG3241498.1 hypothetical protein PI124_g13640 [Phytophthora idaei]
MSGNRDNVERLTPKLFNSFLNVDSTPQSFVGAFNFSISKGGDTSEALNYRPIALLNTDYKTFTRILAWRVRQHIEKLVSKTQFGFILGRNIHHAIDLLEAAMAVASESEELTQAQALLLDFAKAYDSLDREFLFEVLAAKGFPPKFIAIVRAIHNRTTVKFMANGGLSRAMDVSSGIRQGCPLAPLLFILAVDLLYDAIQDNAKLVGICLDEDKKDQQLKAAGCADDTVIYIADKEMQAKVLRTVHEFSRASGLKLNVKKSVVTRLAAHQQPEQNADSR